VSDDSSAGTSETTPAFAVRRLRREDRDAWEPLWHGYLRFYRAQLRPGVSDTTFARLCDGDGDLLGLFAVDAAGTGLGLAHLVFHPSTWSDATYCYLEDLYVDRAARGLGVGDRLFEAIYETARERGAERVYWHTQQFNGAARSLYDTVGHLTSFVVYEREL
jgi:GNAT superfamily N-acetyltransferase